MIGIVRGALFLLCATTDAVISPAYATEKSPDEWIAEADLMLKADPQDAKAYYNRGTGLYGKGDYEAAVKDLSTAIALEPKAPDAYFNRGLSHRRQHRIEQAISDFSNAIELYPAQPGYYTERCNALIVKNDLRAAIADCSEAIRLSPEADNGYFLRGVAHLLRGDLDEALADGAKTQRIWPDHPHARRLLYETLVKRETMIRAHDPWAPYENRVDKIADRSGNFQGGIFKTEKT